MNVHELTLQNYTAASGCPSACQPILYLGTAGSYGNEQINVVLGEGWQGLTVKAVFQPSGVPAVVPNGGGVISVPWEATQSVIAYPNGRISFQGYVSGRLVNTSDVPYTVGGSSAGSDNTPAPTPDEFQQFVDAVKSDADRAAQAAADAEAAVQKVTDAGAQAVTDIGNAKDSALEAIDAAREEAAGSISADVEGAKQAAADAEQSAADAEQSAKDAAGALANVQAAGKSALDDIATERQNALSDIQNEGAKQQSAVAGAGTAALEAIGQTEQAAINQVKQAGETQAAAVQSAGTTQVGLINSAGAAQVQAVKDEGAAQTAALNDAAEARKNELESIASHPPQPNTATGKWQTWNAETGAYQDTDALYQGGYYTPAVSDDGVLTWQGSQPEMPAIPSANIKGPKGDKGDPGLGVPSPTQSDAGKVPTVKADGSTYELAGPYAPLSAAIRPTASGNPVSIADSVEWSLQGLKIYGKSTQDGTPSPENPVPIVSAGDGGQVEVTVCGANFFDSSLIPPNTRNGVSCTVLDDGSIYLSGTPTATAVFSTLVEAENYVRLPQTFLTASINEAAGRNVYALFRLRKGGEVVADFATINNKTVDISGIDYDNIQIGTQASPGSSVNGNFKIMVNVGQNSAPWSPYSGFQSLTISTPNGLPGIHVDSGGNYTDTEGQQSACDVKDYGTGKYTQMVGHIESYNGENITTPYMSTTGQLSTGAEVYYVLDEPVVTNISAEELAAYRALHSYPGTTVITTAEDVAGIEARYVADAQKYIDNRLTAAEQRIQELAAAQLNDQTGG